MDIDAIVFDVLDTLVDEPAAIRAGIRALDPAIGSSEVEHLPSLTTDRLAGWLAGWLAERYRLAVTV